MSACPLLCLSCKRHWCLWAASKVLAGCQHCLPMASGTDFLHVRAVDPQT